MSQKSVEEILTVVRKLPQKERKRLLKSLQRETEAVEIRAKKSKTSANVSNTDAFDQLPSNRDLETKWLLDHPKFWEQHRGEHVALWKYEMISVGQTRKEVVAKARAKGVKFPLVQYLPKEESEWLLGLSNQPLAE